MRAALRFLVLILAFLPGACTAANPKSDFPKAQPRSPYRATFKISYAVGNGLMDRTEQAWWSPQKQRYTVAILDMEMTLIERQDLEMSWLLPSYEHKYYEAPFGSLEHKLYGQYRASTPDFQEKIYNEFYKNDEGKIKEFKLQSASSDFICNTKTVRHNALVTAHDGTIAELSLWLNSENVLIQAKELVHKDQKTIPFLSFECLEFEFVKEFEDSLFEPPPDYEKGDSAFTTVLRLWREQMSKAKSQ